MKATLHLVSALTCWLLAAPCGRATLLVSESFSYADSYLAGHTGSTGFRFPWFSGTAWGFPSPTAMVLSGHAAYDTSGPAFTVENDTLVMSSSINFAVPQVLWLAFDLQALSAATPGVFQGLSLEDTSREYLFMGHSTILSSSATQWQMVQQPGDIYQTTASTNVSAIDSIKTAVVRLTVGSGATSTADMWVGADNIQPVVVTGTPMATATGLTLNSVTAIVIGARSNFVLDNIKLGTTAADVGGVPEPGVGLLLAAGVVALRRRRR